MGILGQFLVVSFVAAIVGVFGLGGLWYSPTLFGHIWNREAGMGGDASQKKNGHPAVVYGVSLLMGVISAFATLQFVIYTHWNLGESMEFYFPIMIGALIGIGLVATSFTINYMFGGRSLKLLAIDAGYNILQFTIFGIVIALWFKYIVAS